MKSFIEYMNDKGDTDLLESRPYKRAVDSVAMHQNVVKTGEKDSITNQYPYADQMKDKTPAGSNA